MKTQALLLSIIVTITGPWTLSSCLSYQYHVVYDKMTWTDAQQHCRDKFTDLATVHTLEDVNTLDSMVVVNRLEGNKVAAWIGLYNSWRWSLAGERFYMDAEFRKCRGQPSGHSPDRLCAYMSHWDGMHPNRSHSPKGIPVGEWCFNAAPCEKKIRAICFNDTDPMRKYIVIVTELTWAEAQGECREKHTDLASVRNHTEYQEIQKVMGNDTGKYWIGLHRDSWKWSDGSSSPFRHWNSGQPDGGRGLEDQCAIQLFGNNRPKWHDMKCSSNASFVCYSIEVKKQVLRVKLTIDSSLNMTGLPDAILEQLKWNMKTHQGAPADIKVRWLKQADGRIFHKDDKKKREKKKRERKAVLTKREL